MALPKLTATDEMNQIAVSDLPRKEKITYGYVQEVCEYYVYLRCITQDGILIFQNTRCRVKCCK